MSRSTPPPEPCANLANLLESNGWTLPTLVGTTLYIRDRKTILALDLR